MDESTNSYAIVAPYKQAPTLVCSTLQGLLSTRFEIGAMVGAFVIFALCASAAVSGLPAPEDGFPFPRAVSDLGLEPRDSADYRLPTGLHPLTYDIKLVPYIVEGNFTFDGEVTIEVHAAIATDNITLHANRLIIDESSIVVTDSSNEEVPVASIVTETEPNFFSIVLSTPLRAGTIYTVKIAKFTGVLDTDMAGFYRSSYVESGKRRWLATTQFEATDARRAFPCFDEPALKARFTLSISRPENLRAIANMPQNGPPVLDTVHTDEVRYWDIFEQTPPMSTYLIAFIVSDFAFLENAAQSLRIFAQPLMISQARYGLEVSPPLLNWLGDFTGIPFQLPKMDEAAIPDFDAGAMENWGLVTYRERLILFEEGVSTSSSRQSIATVIAHEYAHQWFGDLVSPLWWKYIWLNEGFATYFEFFATAQVETTWRLEEQFVVSEVQGAMAGDASQSSHPMTVDVASPAQISSIFDGISYSKAGSVIRMMEHIVSPDIFRRGLRRYLIDRSYDVATADDLFNHMNDQLHEDNPAATIDVKTVMDTWSTQMGFPVVNVTRDYATGVATLTQERFLIKFDPTHPDNKVYKWDIPLTYTTQAVANFDDTTPRDWFNAVDDTKTIPGLPDNNEWVIFNIKENGYYRVNYDAENWALLSNSLDSVDYIDIHLLNRAQLVDDAFTLARAGVLSYDTAMALSQYLVREIDYIPWLASFSSFTFIDRKLTNTQDYSVFQIHILNLIDLLYTTVGFDEIPEDDHITKLNRGQAVRWACNMGDQDCIDHSTTDLAEWIATPTVNPIVPDLRSPTYCTALKYGGSAEWNFMWQQYLDNTVATESTLIISALGCSRDPATLNAYMDLAVTEGSPIRRQDSSSVFSSVYNNPDGIDVALDYVIAEFQKIADYYGSMSSVGNLMINIANRCNQQSQADKMVNFLSTYTVELGSAAASVERAIEIVGENIEWVNTYGQEIITWIIANGGAKKPH